MNILIFIVLFLDATSKISHAEDTEMEWNWEAGIPHYPHPRYGENDEIVFFPRIIGGSPATHGEFRAKISLQTRRAHHTCGGALIDPRHVLTAAHCITEFDGRVFNPDSIRLMGDDLTIDIRGSRTRQIRFATHIFAHPFYDVMTYANDIAVVRVSVPFYLTPTLHPMQRARSTPVAGQICQLAGWGTTHEDRTRPHPILLRVELDVISMDFCNGTNSYRGSVPPMTICAGSIDGSRDACFGDSGGGLICNNQIAGVVSFGFGCGRRNFPGIYADVSSYNFWINECIDSNIPHEDIPRPPIRNRSSGTQSMSKMHLFLVVTLFLTLVKR